MFLKYVLSWMPTWSSDSNSDQDSGRFEDSKFYDIRDHQSKTFELRYCNSNEQRLKAGSRAANAWYLVIVCSLPSPGHCYPSNIWWQVHKRLLRPFLFLFSDTIHPLVTKPKIYALFLLIIFYSLLDRHVHAFVLILLFFFPFSEMYVWTSNNCTRKARQGRMTKPDLHLAQPQLKRTVNDPD